MEPSTIIRETRRTLSLSVRKFAKLLAPATTIGNKPATWSAWECSTNRVPFAEMYYVFHHAPTPEVKEMADQAMRIIRPDLWPEG